MKKELPQALRRWFVEATKQLWPVAWGSLSLRKSPCIRKNCSACAAGKGHLSYALSGYQGKQRFSIYVPDELAPDVQKAIENGRQLQALMKEAGLRYVKARKRERQSRLQR
jgi:molybdopterin-guanine dinucleotide biosynthesis protein A